MSVEKDLQGCLTKYMGCLVCTVYNMDMELDEQAPKNWNH